MSFETNQRRGRNTDMQEKMERIRPGIKTRHNFLDPHRNVSLWLDDGVDHINISSFGKTGLGQALSHASPIRFKHSIFGFFISMESFWHYIQSEEQDDRLRSMTGRNLQNFGRKLTRRMVTNFRAIIMDSNYQRIMQNDKLKEELKNSTLPFDCYYIDRETSFRKRLSYFHWMLQGFEEIRTALKEDREPNFDSLKDDRNSDIYDFVRPAANTVVNQESEEAKVLPFSLLKGFLKKSPTPAVKKDPNDPTNPVAGEGKKKKKKKKKVHSIVENMGGALSSSERELTPKEIIANMGGGEEPTNGPSLSSVSITTVTTAEDAAVASESQVETPVQPEEPQSSETAVDSTPSVTI